MGTHNTLQVTVETRNDSRAWLAWHTHDCVLTAASYSAYAEHPAVCAYWQTYDSENFRRVCHAECSLISARQWDHGQQFGRSATV